MTSATSCRMGSARWHFDTTRSSLELRISRMTLKKGWRWHREMRLEIMAIVSPSVGNGRDETLRNACSPPLSSINCTSRLPTLDRAQQNHTSSRANYHQAGSQHPRDGVQQEHHPNNKHHQARLSIWWDLGSAKEGAAREREAILGEGARVRGRG